MIVLDQLNTKDSLHCINNCNSDLGIKFWRMVTLIVAILMLMFEEAKSDDFCA